MNQSAEAFAVRPPAEIRTLIDRALRRYGREMKERSRFDDILVTVRAYLIKTDD